MMRRTRSPFLPLLAVAGLAFLLSGLGAPGAQAAPPADAGIVGFHCEPLTIVSDEQRRELGSPGKEGSVVALVVPGGPADKAGLRLGDLLVGFAGKDVPQLHTSDRYDPKHHEWRVAMREMLGNVEAGKTVEVKVLRDGKPLTLELTPVDAEEMHRMQAGTQPETPAPTFENAGVSSAFDTGFGSRPSRSLPVGMWAYEGHWTLAPEPGTNSGNVVLRQDHATLPWAVLLATGPGRSLADGKVRVLFKPLSGVVDQSGGIVFRAQDGLNYYVARANALEDNFRIYIVKDGVRSELGSTRLTPPDANHWHVLEVTFSGTSFRATVDGKDPVEAQDATFASGWCGLWTKADSVTLFDDFRITPAMEGR